MAHGKIEADYIEDLIAGKSGAPTLIMFSNPFKIFNSLLAELILF